MRVDWESCFHCGARGPVTRPIAKRVLDAAALCIVVGTLTTMAVRIGSVWSAVSAAPDRLVSAVVANVVGTVMPKTAAAIAPAPEVKVAVVTPLTRAARAGVPLATLSPPTDSAARAFDEARIDRAIAAARSRPALDRLEARLRADYPGDPRLRPDGRTGRRLAARRAQLARS